MFVADSNTMSNESDIRGICSILSEYNNNNNNNTTQLYLFENLLVNNTTSCI